MNECMCVYLNVCVTLYIFMYIFYANERRCFFIFVFAVFSQDI